MTWEEEIGATFVSPLGGPVLPELQLGLRPHPVAQRCNGLQQPGLVKLGAEVNVGDLELLSGWVQLD